MNMQQHGYVHQVNGQHIVIHQKANYAIGSPTAEMYVASYNQVSHSIGNYKLGVAYREKDDPGYIYTLNGKQSAISGSDYWTGDNTLDYTGYNSMYCGRKWF